MAVSLPIGAQTAAAHALFALPEPARRVLAGRPVRRDGQQLALEAQLLLRLQQVSGQSMVLDGVQRSRRALDAAAPMVSGKPIQPIDTTELSIPAQAPVPATLYTPADIAETSGLLVFYHGGGWVLGSRRSHDNAARFLASRAGVRVLSVEYRLAPEHPFPAAVEDALAAYEYAATNAASLGADPARIAVGGDSAGGNLAAVVAQQARGRGGPSPAFQLLLYPAMDATVRRRSRDVFGDGFFLTDAHMTWFVDHYAPPGVDRADPKLSPLLADDLSGLPPAYIATAGFDPLRDEGEAYAAKLREAGVATALSRHSDLIHGYVNFLAAGRRFAEATAEAAGALRVGLATPN